MLQLTLLKSDNVTGYLGVRFNGRPNVAKPYVATEWRGGKTVALGYFVTAEEAALCRAGIVKWGGVDSFFTTLQCTSKRAKRTPALALAPKFSLPYYPPLD